MLIVKPIRPPRQRCDVSFNCLRAARRIAPRARARIGGLRQHETLAVACCLRGRPYKEQKELPISYALGDNSACFQKFVTEELDLEANVCQTHATAIAKNNGTHSTYFDSNENYEVFYDFLCSIMRFSFPDAGVRLQELLVLSLLWLRSVRETRAADWFERYWCGPIKGP